jgi:hypothetical protein
LLLDMGRPVTITSAQIMLGAMTGADFQLRACGEPVLADLRPVARATDAGGVVTLRPARTAKARYLLLWFTRLPPDSSGTFEAIVYDVRLHGTPVTGSSAATCSRHPAHPTPARQPPPVAASPDPRRSSRSARNLSSAA